MRHRLITAPQQSTQYAELQKRLDQMRGQTDQQDNNKEDSYNQQVRDRDRDRKLAEARKGRHRHGHGSVEYHRRHSATPGWHGHDQHAGNWRDAAKPVPLVPVLGRFPPQG